ncbi:hypothetical protein K492DRAFT_185524 [Lichtheimia hyalospora FSU 10163]|nr:hypothetical protein K492DRAFT_185524 [Lichtheimia hyalospora FSU 10163]
MFFVGICYATFITNEFERCLKEKYSIDTDPGKELVSNQPGTAILYFCNQDDPVKGKFCIAPYICAKDTTPDDLLTKYKSCGVDATFKTSKSTAKKQPKNGEIGGQCEQWRYCYGEARCENYKCVPHACKKEGEVPNGPDDKCCMPMITKQGTPCKLLDTDHSLTGACNSHRKCQLDHEGRDYVCCYTRGRENPPTCTLNKDCKRFSLYEGH